MSHIQTWPPLVFLVHALSSVKSETSGNFTLSLLLLPFFGQLISHFRESSIATLSKSPSTADMPMLDAHNDCLPES